MNNTTLAVAVATVLAAGSAAAQDDTLTIGYAVMGYNHPLFQAMMRGADEAAADLGVTLERVDAQFDVNRQIGQIKDFIAKGVDVLLVNPVTAQETVPILEKARAAGIPVVAIDTRPIGFSPDAYVTMNHFQGGYTIGWRIATDLQCKGLWAPIWAIGNEQAASRMRGLEAGMAEACAVMGMENGFRKEGDYSGITGPLRETARQITDTLLAKYGTGELAFVFGQTDEFANGAFMATEAAGRADVKIYAMDNNADIRSFIGEGSNLVATTAHLPVEVGRAAVQTAVNIARKEPFLPEVQLNFQLIDAANLQFDPGWEGTYAPSFSAFAFSEQLSALK